MEKIEAIQYLQSHKMDIQSAIASYLALTVAFESYVDAYEGELCFGPCFSHFEKSYKGRPYFHQISDKEKIERIADKLFDDYAKNPESLDAFIENHRKSNERGALLWKKYKEEKKKNRESLEKFFSDFLEEQKTFWRFALVGEDKGEVLDRKVVPEFAKLKNISIYESRKIIQVLSHPNEPAVFNVERKDFLKLCLLFQKSKENEFNKNLNDYLNKYFWFKTDFYGNAKFNEEIVVSEIEEELLEKDELKLKEEIVEIENNFHKLKEKKEKLLNELNLTEKEKNLIDFAEKVSLWIDKRKKWMMEDFFYLFDFADEAARLLGVSSDEVLLCSQKEIIEWINNGNGLSEDILNLRRGEFLIIFEKDKKEKVFSGKEAREILDVALGKTEDKVRGTVASVGGEDVVSGRASVVIHTSKDDFNSGDILVTSMTRVEFVPLMKKSKAVITNEGGMACHAAIVSRELGLPAIIGTKNATRVIKSGDLVEMNMKTGEIKVKKDE